MARYGRNFDDRGSYGGGSPRGAGRDMRFGNWGDRSGLRSGGRGGYDRQFARQGWGRGGEPFRTGRASGGPGGYGRDYDRSVDTGGIQRGPFPRRASGRTHLTGMESNRYRGVYDSGFRPQRDDWDASHGGYRGEGWNRGGGMNPGRRGR